MSETAASSPEHPWLASDLAPRYRRIVSIAKWLGPRLLGLEVPPSTAELMRDLKLEAELGAGLEYGFDSPRPKPEHVAELASGWMLARRMEYKPVEQDEDGTGVTDFQDSSLVLLPS